MAKELSLDELQAPPAEAKSTAKELSLEELLTPPEPTAEELEAASKPYIGYRKEAVNPVPQRPAKPVSVLEGRNLGVPDFATYVKNQQAANQVIAQGQKEQEEAQRIASNKAAYDREDLRKRAEQQQYGATDLGADVGLGLIKGGVGLGQMAMGAANIATGWIPDNELNLGQWGKMLDKLGYDPQKTNNFISGFQSPLMRNQVQNVAETKGFLDTVKALAVNPLAVVDSVTESLPGTVLAGAAGGQLTKMLMMRATQEAAALGLTGTRAENFIADKIKSQAYKIAGAASGAEGAQTAGQIAEQAREGGADWDQYVAPALAAGLGTTAIGMVGGKLAQKFGIGDIETDIAARSAGVKGVGVGEGAFLTRALKEMTKEGFFEELPQSAQEQIFTNLATGRPWDEGVSQASAQGLITGMAMAGGHASTVELLQKTSEAAQKALGTREGAYKQDTSYQGLSDLIARSKGFLTPEQREQQELNKTEEPPEEKPTGLGAIGEVRPKEEAAPPKELSLEELQTPPTEIQPPAKPEDRVAQRTAQIVDERGIPEDDARRLAQTQIEREDQEAKAKAATLVSQPQKDRISQRASELLSSGVVTTSAQAMEMARTQVEEEDEADALAKEEEQNVGKPIDTTGRVSTGTPVQPTTVQPTGELGVTQRNGVVSTKPNVGQPNAGEAAQSTAITEGAPSGTQASQAKQTKAQKQKAPTTTATVGRPSLDPNVKAQQAEEKKPVRALIAKVNRALSSHSNLIDQLSKPIPQAMLDKLESDEAVNALNSDRLKRKRDSIKKLLRLQTEMQANGQMGSEPGKRLKAALANSGLNATQIADIQRGIELEDKAKAAQAEAPSRADTSVGKDPADTRYNKFTTGAQAISHIVKTGNAFQRTLAKRLRSFVAGVRFVVIEEGQPLPAQLQTPKNARLWNQSIGLYIENYKTNDRVIYVRGNSFGNAQGINNVTVLHELLHAATNRKIAAAIDAIKRGINLESKSVKAAQDLIRTMNSAGRLFNEASRQGKLTKEMRVLAASGEIFDDPREFVAYGMTDRAMQDFLMQAHGYEEDTPFFNRFVRALRDFFNMGEDDVNALTDLIIVTDKLINAPALPIESAISSAIEHASSMFGVNKKEGVTETETKAAPSANVQRLSKMLGNKLYGTPDDIAKVSIKELFQNSFDAIKEAIEKGQMAKGKVNIKLDQKNRTISVVDNGPGMPTSVMGNQFLQIAGTVKGTTRASGGLGVAKMLFLFENKELEVVSLRNGVLSRMVTTGDDLKAALDDPSRGPTITTTDDSSVIEKYKSMFPDGHGTSVTVTIPETYEDTSTGETKKIPFEPYSLEDSPVLEDSPLFDDIDVTFDRGYGPKTLKIGAHFPIDDYTVFANVRFAWGVARVYISKDKVNSYSDNTHILSNGLWQFNTNIKDRPGWDGKKIKRNFYVDVSPSPNVKPEDAGYPFDLNRQRFSSAADDDFKKIFNYITAIYSQIDLASDVTNFGTVQYLNEDGTLTKPEELTPKAPKTDNAFTLIKPGDKVEVKEGVLYVNNRQIPELTNDDLKNVAIRVDELTIPQDEIDPIKVMIHDNTKYDDNKSNFTKLHELELSDPKRYEFYSAPSELNPSEFTIKDPDGTVTKLKGTEPEIVEELEKRGILTKGGDSLSDKARKEFGKRYDKYLQYIGETFQVLRSALVQSGNGEYFDLGEEAIGVSIDNEYYGVSIKLPFRGMFLNPATTDQTDTPMHIALSMIGTMIHELAHYKQRNHGAEFASEMQKVMILLKTSPTIDLPDIEKGLTKFIDDNQDIFDFLHKEFRSGNLKPRGNRFQDGSYQQVEAGGGAEPMEGAGGAGEGRRSLSAISGPSTPSAGTVGVGAGSTSQTPAVGTAVRSQKQVERDVKVASAKFDESQSGEEYSKGVSLLQLAQDPREVIPALRAIWNVVPNATRQAMVRMVTPSFLVDWVGNAVPELKHTNELLQRMSGMTTQLLKSAGKLTDEIRRAFLADPTLQAKLDRITHITTLAEVDPSNPNAKVRSAQLDKLYKDLGKDGQRLYKRIKDHFEVLSDYFTQLLNDQITKSNVSIAIQANLMKQIRAIYEQGEKINPYFPLVRRGDYWLSMGDRGSKNHKFFMFESMAERDRALDGYLSERVKQKPGETKAEFAKRRAEELKELLDTEEFVVGNDISHLRRSTFDSSALLRGIFQTIDSANFGNTDAKESLKDAVYQIYLQTMPEQSFRKQFIHRQGKAGFRTDLLRNVADTSAKMATQLARIKYAPQLRLSLSQARDSIVNRTDFEPYVAEMERQVTEALSSKAEEGAEKIAGWLNKAAFIWYLGGPSSAILQGLSVFQTGFPVLWARHGAIAAGRELTRMLNFWGQYGHYVKNADGTRSWAMPSVEHNYNLSKTERSMYNKLSEMDVFSSTYANRVFQYKKTPTADLSGPIMTFAKGTVDTLVLGGLMHSAERISREMIAMSSARLHYAKFIKDGLTSDEAEDRAVQETVHDVNEALGNQNAYNRPRFMKGAVGKVLTQFMMYPIHVTLFLLKNFKEMIKPMDGHTRAEAAKKFFGAMGTTLILGGVAAMPWVFSAMLGALSAAWDALKDDDWPDELKNLDFWFWFRTVEMKKLLGDMQIGGHDLGDAVYNIVDRGLANYITGSDVSSRVSFNNLFFRESKEEKTIKDSAMAMALDKAGPAANMVLSFAEAYEAYMLGDYKKALHKVAPAGFRNYATAYELWKEGSKDNKGAEILSRDNVTTGRIIFQAVGFRPDLLANAQYVNFKVIGLNQKIDNERQQIMDRINRAEMENDQPEFQKALQLMGKFNSQHPTKAIKGSEIAKSLQSKAAQRGKSQMGVSLDKRTFPIFGEAIRPSRQAIIEDRAKHQPAKEMSLEELQGQ